MGLGSVCVATHTSSPWNTLSGDRKVWVQKASDSAGLCKLLAHRYVAESPSCKVLMFSSE